MRLTKRERQTGLQASQKEVVNENIVGEGREKKEQRGKKTRQTEKKTCQEKVIFATSRLEKMVEQKNPHTLN